MQKEDIKQIKRTDSANVAEQSDAMKKYAQAMENDREEYVFSMEEMTEEKYRSYVYRTSPEWQSNIMEYSTISFELTKLYTAIGMDRMCQTAIKKGVSTMDAESVKRDALIDISQAGSLEELHNLAAKVAVNYNSMYRNFMTEQYSYPVIRADEYIRQHRNTKCMPADVANAVELNPAYLSKLFKKETGKTLTEHIAETKIGTAKELLTNHMYSLREVSELLGFSDYAYFSKCFKRQTGMTPAQFVKSAQNKI